MKRILISLAAAAICLTAAAQGNNTAFVPSDDSVVIIDDFQDNIRERYRYGEDPGWTMGFDLDVAFPMYFGWTSVLGGDYTGSWKLTEDEYGDFMDGSLWRNFSYSLDVARINFSAGRNLQLYLGVRYTSEQYSLKNAKLYIVNDRFGNPVPVRNTESINYSIIGLRTWGVPFGVTVASGRWTFSANVAAEWKSRATSRYNGNDVEYLHKNLSGFNDFRLSYTVMAGYAGSGLFVRYSGKPILEKGVGYDKATPLTFGFVLGI